MDTIIKSLTQTKVIVLLAVIFTIAVFVVNRQRQIEAAAIHYPVPTEVVGHGLITQKRIGGHAGFDINGSYECVTASSSAYIKNKRVYIENRSATPSSYLVFNGDCIYTWRGIRQNATKSCGFSQYVSIADTLSGSGMFDISSMLSSALDPKTLDSMGATAIAGNSIKPQEYIKQLVSSCRASNIIDPRKFIVPTGIQFKKSGQ